MQNDAYDEKNKKINKTLMENNYKVIESFFSLQEKIIETNKELFSSKEGVRVLQQLISNNQRVMEEYLRLQAEPAPGFTTESRTQDTLPDIPVSAVTKDNISDKDIEYQLKKEIADLTGFPVDMITDDSNFNKDLGLDSISMMKIMMVLIKQFPHLEAVSQELKTAISIDDIRLILQQAGIGQHGKTTEQEADILTLVIKHLKQEIADVTGFPEDMITEESNFNKDLGPDSISMMKIMMALVKKFPQFDEASQELKTASSIHMISEILKHHQSTKTMNTLTTPQEPQQNNTDHSLLTKEPVHRYLPQKNKIDINELRTDSHLPGSIIVVSKKNSATNNIIESITANNITVTPLYYTDDQWELPNGDTFPLTETENLGRFLQSTKHNNYLPPVIVYNFQETSSLNDLSEQKYTRIVDSALISSFCLAKGILHAFNNGTVYCDFISIICKEEDSLLFDSCMGFAKSLNMEWPETYVSVFGVNNAPTSKDIAAIIPVLQNKNVNMDIIFTSGSYEQKILNTNSLAAHAEKMPATTLNLNENSNIILSGGASGVTAELGTALAARFKCTIIALGRTPFTETDPYPGINLENELKAVLIEEAKKSHEKIDLATIQQTAATIQKQRTMLQTMEKIQNTGSRFFYYQADLTDYSTVKSVITTIKKKHGSIHGLVHGAGFSSDSILANKKLPDFHNVIRAKSHSAFNLYTYLKKEPLQFAFLMSSVNPYIGNYGQTDYSAANGLLNTIASLWNKEVSYPVKALLWAIWVDSGFISRNSLLLNEMQKAGVSGISNSEGTRLFLNELLHGKKEQSNVILTTDSTIHFANSSAELQKKPVGTL